jgi:DNA-binding MarR family transcriptional regulator
MSEPSPDHLTEAKLRWIEHGWPDADLMVTATSIMRLSRLVSSHIDAALRPLDLSYARFETLSILFFEKDTGLPLGKLSERLQVHPATVTSIVDRLEQQGLVRRARREGDRRIVLAELLDPGRELVQRANEVVVREVLPKMRLPKKDQDKLYELLGTIRRSIGDLE